jgi:hypothetical protein
VQARLRSHERSRLRPGGVDESGLPSSPGGGGAASDHCTCCGAPRIRAAARSLSHGGCGAASFRRCAFARARLRDGSRFQWSPSQRRAVGMLRGVGAQRSGCAGSLCPKAALGRAPRRRRRGRSRGGGPDDAVAGGVCLRCQRSSMLSISHYPRIRCVAIAQLADEPSNWLSMRLPGTRLVFSDLQSVEEEHGPSLCALVAI